jgi:hypothetical protein
VFKITFLTFAYWMCCGPCPLHGQDVMIRSGFFADSLTVGEETGYYLSATYPSNLNIIFPDSATDFGPFEFERKKYFPTQSSGGKSYDSVIYYLSSFEIESIQTLSLPIYQLNVQDCTMFESNVDTIRLQELVKNLPDSLTAQNLPLKVNTIYEDVPYLFNYPVFLIIGGVIVVILLVVWLVFGKKIRKHFKLKRMLKAHQKFLEGYSDFMQNIQNAFSTVTTESALFHWKKYMEQLESRPYTKLTTRETTQLENNEALGKNLHTIDGAIYGHNTSVVESLEHLKRFADERFAQKLEEVKHG